MADDIDNIDTIERRILEANTPQDADPTDPRQDTRASSKPNSSRRLRFPRFKSNWDFPKIRLPRFRSDKTGLPNPKTDFPWMWLITILIGYTFISYFLSVVLTIPAHQNLAIAGFAIAALLPTITAFADYALMKWGYLISGFLIVGGLIFVARVQFYFIFLAIMLWLSTTAIAFVGQSLVRQNRRFFVAIVILTIPCLLGLVAGWQIWRFVATRLS
jgi:hypothetical protein